MPRLKNVSRPPSTAGDTEGQKKGSNLQIYFSLSESDPSILNVSPKWKKDFFLCGVLSCLDDVARLKRFFSENRTFGISEIQNDTVIYSNGSRCQGNFLTEITDSHVPQNDNKIFCAVSTVKKLFHGSTEVPVYALLYCNAMPQLKNGKTMDNETKKNIKSIIDLFGNSLDRIGDLITEDHVAAVGKLEQKVA